jgi:hypothetical protein
VKGESRMNRLFAVVVFTFVFLALFAQTMGTSATSTNPVKVHVGVWLINVEKVDLSANSYRLDFYLWFNYDPSEINLSQIQQFEFINGAPTMYIIV